jgi:hypothetical protein
MEKFTLQHIVLYSKGWYKKYNPKSTKRKTIWDDLEILIQADGYLGCLESDSLEQKKNRIAYLLVSQMSRIPLTGNARTITDFFEAIKPHNCWKYGYYTNQNGWINPKKDEVFPEWDINEAAVRYCLSEFSRLEKSQWIEIKPDKNVLPLSNSVSNKKIKEIFKN